MLKLLQKIDKFFVKLCNVFLVFTVVTMVGMVVWGVVCRYALHSSAPYAEEFARLAIVWCILIGGAMAVRGNEHIRVESLVHILPRGLQIALEFVSHVLVLIFSFVIMWYGFIYTGQTINDITTSLGYSRSVFFLPTALAGLIMLVYSIANICLLVYNTANHKQVTLKSQE